MIITLCGSMRFLDYFDAWNDVLSCAGHLVFSIGVRSRKLHSVEKVILDEVHRCKIRESDAILVLNPFAYIGESTLNEIEHARHFDKEIRFLQRRWGKGLGLGPSPAEAVRVRALHYQVPHNFRSPIDTSCYRSPFDGHIWLGEGGPRRASIVNRLIDFI